MVAGVLGEDLEKKFRAGLGTEGGLFGAEPTPEALEAGTSAFFEQEVTRESALRSLREVQASRTRVFAPVRGPTPFRPVPGGR